MADTGAFPLADVAVEIVDEDDVPLPRGRDGTVRIRSPRNATRYLHDPEATAAVYHAGWVYPGDRGHLESDDSLRLIDASTTSSTAAAKFDPVRLEPQMADFSDVHDIALFGFADAQDVPRLCAAVVAGPAYDGERFAARCRDALGVAMPDFLMELRELPRNENGKLLRRSLAEAARKYYAGLQARH